MEAQLRDLGLADCMTRVTAVDGKQDSLEGHGYVPSNNAAQWRMKPSEIAVFESHKLVWKKIVDQEIPLAMVLEDDVVFAPGAGAALKVLVNGKFEGDAIKLDGIPGKMRFGCEQGNMGGMSSRSILEIMPSSASYLISFDGAKRMLERSLEYSEPVDLMMFAPHPNWQVFQAFPAIAAQGMFIREIDMLATDENIRHSERLNGKSFKTNLIKAPIGYRLRAKLRRRLSKIANALWKDRVLENQGGFVGEIPLLNESWEYRR